MTSSDYIETYNTGACSDDVIRLHRDVTLEHATMTSSYYIQTYNTEACSDDVIRLHRDI